MSSPIKEFYKQKNIFITGATGLVGQLLIEKLLRFCDVGDIYVLIRGKKDVSWQKRFDEIWKHQIYDKLREVKPNFTHQIVPVFGDCSLPSLGLSQIAFEKLQNNVNIVFHCAAVVSFNKPLATVIKTNVEAFSQCNVDIVEEKFYKPEFSGSFSIDLANNLDEQMLDTLYQSVKGRYPNTYCFSKSLAEDLVREEASTLPTVVIRPASLLGIKKDPLPGWINNLYGPIGVTCAVFRGTVRTARAINESPLITIPADYCVNGILAATWDTCRYQNESIPVYNLVPHTENFINYSEYAKLMALGNKKYPTIQAIRSYSLSIHNDLASFKLPHFIHHIVPAFIVDAGLVLTNRKPVVLKGYRQFEKLNNALGAVTDVIMHPQHDNVTALWNSMTPRDREWLYFDFESLDWNEYLMTVFEGMRLYLLKDKPETIVAAKRKQKLLAVAEFAVDTTLTIGVSYLLYKTFRAFYAS